MNGGEPLASDKFLDPDLDEALADQLIDLAAEAIGRSRSHSDDPSFQADCQSVVKALDVPVLVRGQDAPAPLVDAPEDAEAWIEVGPRWEGSITIVAVVRGRRYSARIHESGEAADRAAEVVVRFRAPD